MAGASRKKRRKSRHRVPSVASDFANAELGDPRLTRRLVAIAEACSAAPDRSFPDIAESKSELEGLYRFTGNGRVDPQDVLDAHSRETAARCREVRTLLVAHDTTECVFGGEVEREGLGPLGVKSRGFLFHASLAVEFDGTFARPLGVVHAIPWVRKPRRQTSQANRADVVKESARWDAAVRGTRAVLGDKISPINLMDREGDAYPLLAAMVERRDRFVVRAAYDRVVFADGDRLLLREAIARAEQQIQVEVVLSKRGEARPTHQLEKFPARDRRTA